MGVVDQNESAADMVYDVLKKLCMCTCVSVESKDEALKLYVCASARQSQVVLVAVQVPS